MQIKANTRAVNHSYESLPKTISIDTYLELAKEGTVTSCFSSSAHTPWSNKSEHPLETESSDPESASDGVLNGTLS